MPHVLCSSVLLNTTNMIFSQILCEKNVFIRDYKCAVMYNFDEEGQKCDDNESG